MRRRAKIGATLGPASDDNATLARMVSAGVDVARLNFSHGTVVDHARRVRRIRTVVRSAGRTVAVMADLQGPRFRVGRLPGGIVQLVAGESIRLIAGTQSSPKGTIPVSYAALARDIRKGERILMDDGKIELLVDRVRGDTVRCEIVRGGPLSDNKGINLPGSRLSTSALTNKDRRDLRTAVDLGADWLAVSFVRRREDIKAARRLLHRAGSEIPVMAKIELPQAIENLTEILDEADGLLVARGDLGVELPPQEVPVLQKQIIDAANAEGKPVMTATQMLESMRYSSRPTRAEASDVANAVLDGSSCLLLTAETAAGNFPAESVEMMAGIIEHAEGSGRSPRRPFPPGELSVPLSTCLAGCRTAFEVGAKYLAVFTQSGFSVRHTARFRPRTPIMALTPTPAVVQQLNMLWGVEPRRVPQYRTTEQMIRALDRVLLKDRLVKRGELVVMLSGHPVGVPGTTNLMEVHRVGDKIDSRRKKGSG